MAKAPIQAGDIVHRFEIENEQDKFPVTKELLERFSEIADIVLDVEGIESSCEISLTFVDNDRIRAINSEFRNMDKATDVLSFPQYESLKDEDEVDEEMALGDIVISMERAYEQAMEYGHSFERELCFLFTHSMFHLMGYDHETMEDTKEMRQMEEYVLGMIGMSRQIR
jgi:probable rRNA maturation factor